MTGGTRAGAEYATLHEKLLATGQQRGLFSHIYRDHFKKCPTVEASSAFTFFWDSDLAPDQEEISLEEFPNLKAPIEGMAFIEGQKPINRQIIGANVGKIGFAIMVSDYEQMRREELPQLEVLEAANAALLLTIQPFWEHYGPEPPPHDPEAIEGDVCAFPVAFAIPVRTDGRASLLDDKPTTIDSPHSDPGYCVLETDDDRSDCSEEELRAVEHVDKVVLGGPLFAIGCLIAAVNGRGSVEGAPDSYLKLEIDSLIELLMKRGKAKRDGLFAAMDACRAEFRYV